MNIWLANILFNIANLLFIGGSISLINGFRKNPIKYKILSCWMTLIAMLNVQVAYVCLENYFSILLALPTVIYWTIASVYSIIKSFQLRKLRKEQEEDAAIDSMYEAQYEEQMENQKVEPPT